MKQTLTNIVRAFSPFEFVLFVALAVGLILSGLSLIADVSAPLMEDVPERGGSLTEGIVGSPRFANPLLALSDADRDIAALVYSGLLLWKPNGDLVENLAESYTISDDGLTYTFTLREDVSFHDGERVTADDVVFTITKTQDPALKSPRRASWDGILVERVNERTVRFTLKQPYAPFLGNTTIGILPEHIWREADTEQFQFSKRNTEPIGSGPFKISGIKRDGSGIPISYTLSAFGEYALGRPYLDTIAVRFYPNESELMKALARGEVEGAGSVSPQSLASLEGAAHIETALLPRIFAVFFNQNQAALFTNKEVRVALNVALDKDMVIQDVLGGYGSAIGGPIPEGTLRTAALARGSEKSETEVMEEDASEDKSGDEREDTGEAPADEKSRIGEARAILEKNGWEYDEKDGVFKKETKKETHTLSFSLATSNVPELVRTAEIIAGEWRRLGASVDIHVFETADLNQNVIRPRKYDALLFGEVVGRDLDLFAFWHSSQRNDPGLNIALYANIAADKYLEDARRAVDRAEREEYYRLFSDEIASDAPAVFLYAPLFIYIVPAYLRGASLGPVMTPEERFANVHEWYTRTNRVWSIFTRF